MAPHSSVFLGVLLSALVASACASPGKDQAPSNAAADKFLRACCANTTDAAVCYNSLRPRAGSFKGNVVKVASAATVMAYARLRSFDTEIRNLLRGGTGAGEYLGMALDSCASHFEFVLSEENSVLAKFWLLETAAGRRGKHAESVLSDVTTGVGNVETSTDLLCICDFLRVGSAVLASPLGKMMLAGNSTVTIYGGVALDLVGHIKL